MQELVWVTYAKPHSAQATIFSFIAINLSCFQGGFNQQQSSFSNSPHMFLGQIMSVRYQIILKQNSVLVQRLSPTV